MSEVAQEPTGRKKPPSLGEYLCNSAHLIPETKDVHKLYKSKKRTGREMWLTAQIGDYEMDQVILDLGSDANVLPKQTWQWMGKPKLEWSTI